MLTDEATLVTLDCYAPLWDNDSDINLLWGGRDSGKSFFIAQKLIADCLSEEYFRCILIKKTHESIKDAQWQTIKDIVTSSGMAHLFTFLKSPLEIHCNINSNVFIARGCDNPAKMKSIANPSTVWIEEGNQLSEEDYLTITTSLRTNIGKVMEWVSFNPETIGDYKEHWIYRNFFEGEDALSFTRTKMMIVGEIEYPLTYTSTHTTYQDNIYCKPEQIARHESLKEINPHRYLVFTKGLWGNEENKNPWAWALNRDKHVRPDKFAPSINYNIDLSFDFNHDPCTVVIGQFEQHLPRYNVFAYFRASSGDQSALKQLCDRIYREFPHHSTTKQMTVTGDPSGTNRDPSRPSTLNRYTDICGHLGISTGVVKIEKAHAAHKSSRDLCNDVLHLIPKGGYVFWGGHGMRDVDF